VCITGITRFYKGAGGALPCDELEIEFALVWDCLPPRGNPIHIYIYIYIYIHIYIYICIYAAPLGLTPLQGIASLQGFCARVNHPNIVLPTCIADSIAILLHNDCAYTTLSPALPCVCHTPYNIGSGSIMSRPRKLGWTKFGPDRLGRSVYGPYPSFSL